VNEEDKSYKTDAKPPPTPDLGELRSAPNPSTFAILGIVRVGTDKVSAVTCPG
jgi:hypothetical protein